MIKIIRDRTEYPKARGFLHGQKFVKFKTFTEFGTYQNIQIRKDEHKAFMIIENQFGEVWAND